MTTMWISGNHPAAGAVAAVAAVLFGLLAAGSRASAPRPAGLLLDALMAIPLVTPSLAVYHLLPPGLLDCWWLGALVLMFSAAPLTYFSTRNSFLTLDSALVDTARLLGLSMWSTLGKVWLPVGKSALLLGIALAVARVAAELTALTFLSPPAR